MMKTTGQLRIDYGDVARHEEIKPKKKKAIAQDRWSVTIGWRELMEKESPVSLRIRSSMEIGDTLQ